MKVIKADRKINLTTRTFYMARTPNQVYIFTNRPNKAGKKTYNTEDPDVIATDEATLKANMNDDSFERLMEAVPLTDNVSSVKAIRMQARYTHALNVPFAY